MNIRFGLSVAALSLFFVHCGTSSPMDDAAVGMDATQDTSDDSARDDAREMDAMVDATFDATVDAEGDANDASVELPGDPVRGATLYGTHCALCHGDRGQGYLADHAPAVTNEDFLRIATNEYLFAAIYDGRPGTPMSAWGDDHGGPFSGVDAYDVLSFLRTFAIGPPVDVSAITAVGLASNGGVIYQRECARCHGAEGEGVTAPALRNVVFQDTASDGFILRTIERGRRGTDMAAFGGSVTELGDLLAFVRTLRHEEEPEWPLEDPPTVGSIVLNPTGGAPGFTLRDDRYVPAADVYAAYMAGQRMVLLDARAASDWALGHIPGAAPFPFYDVEDLVATLPDDGTWIIAYCACPHAASGHVVDVLRERGFETTAVLDEGIYYWRDEGYPMARGRLP